MKYIEQIIKTIVSRYQYMIELRQYEKEKRAEDLWVAQQEEIDLILGTDYAKDLK